MSASVLPTIVPTHSWVIGTSFWMTGVTTTPGGGGGGGGSFDGQPARITMTRAVADAQSKGRGALPPRLLAPPASSESFVMRPRLAGFLLLVIRIASESWLRAGSS